MSYNELKRRCLERFFSRTNERQREAIFQTQGAVLIIAGAGSGKTTVLCNRIANLLLFGDAYNSDFEPVLEDDERLFLEQFADGELEIDSESTEKLSRIIGFRRAKPWKILAVTFTNKAAAELKERLSRMNAPADEVWASTFHSACVKILRRGIENIGYKSTFTIYDTDDSQRVIKDVMKYLGISDKAFSPKDIANKISRAKDKLIRPEDYPVFDEDGSKGDFMARRIKEVYTEYQKRLRAANALDFDDIIMKTVELFETSPDVLQYWQEKFDYVMVDEYQDTNGAQYRLVSLLAGKSGNLCVVGDEDQSIYRFRGATIENILSFEKQFDAHAIKLEQNYRSTQTILNAANAVISNNSQRKGKNLWSDMGDGDKISLHLFSNEQLEATFVADTVMKNRELGGEWKDNVVLYRTNSQSRTIELALSRQGIPYRIFGGTKFYERKEIKDILAYMSVINNPFDTVRFKRIINEPKRGIGDSTQATILEISDMLGISPVEVLERADEFAGLSRKATALVALGQVFRELMSRAEDSSELDSLIDDILSLTGYEEALAKEGDEGKGRLENIKELKSGIINFLEENPTATLSDYLEQIALITDLDSYNEDDDKVVLMTMHGAKGLEFNTVFLVGAEENLFPSSRSAFDPSEVEEERRLAYVAITRAKKQLYITHARERLLYGQTQRNKVSRFVTEIPEKYLSFENHTQPIAYSSATFVKKSSGGYLQQQEQQRKAVQSALSGAQTLNVGERVYHKAFGSGTVISVTKMANDQLVEIAFDKVGTKKLMANFAKLIKE